MQMLVYSELLIALNVSYFLVINQLDGFNFMIVLHNKPLLIFHNFLSDGMPFFFFHMVLCAITSKDTPILRAQQHFLRFIMLRQLFDVGLNAMGFFACFHSNNGK